MTASTWIIPSALWLAWAGACRLLENNPRGDGFSGAVWYLNILYCRIFHRLRVTGAENIPRDAHPGTLVVVCNHTAGIDPLLVAAAVPFFVRWMMGLDMMLDRFRGFWEWAEIVAVNRRGRDMAGTREAVRHLERGGVLGVFPEGGLERPANRFRRFHEGVGFMIARTHAPVLPVWIRGTPQVDPAWASLWRPGRAELTFGPVMDFAERNLAPAEITREIQAWFERVSGWPAERTSLDDSTHA
ncbi:hypothetical protein PHYC_02570 [Phycisphaerales bacterium]|nr:hypothetical protein PHYC_02570 [Phycisphaerales bacterium]